MVDKNVKTCGEALVELLQSYGIEVVFGIPGVHTVELYRGLPNTRLRHITPRSNGWHTGRIHQGITGRGQRIETDVDRYPGNAGA